MSERSRIQLEVAGRRCTIVSLDPPWSDLPPFPSSPFVLLLWDGGTCADIDERRKLAEALVDSSCGRVVGIVCGGADCEAWHDTIDDTWVVPETVLGEEIEPTLLTTWHEEESIEDVAHFALHCVDVDVHHDVFVLLLGGSEELVREIREALVQVS